MKDLAMLLHETAAMMRRRFEQVARPEGLTLMQWRTLGLLARHGPLRQVAVGTALEASPMTVSDLAERMEAAALITRFPDPEDGRAKMLALTEAGERKLETMRSISEAAFAEILDGLGPGDIAALRGALTRIKDNLGSAKAPDAKDTAA